MRGALAQGGRGQRHSARPTWQHGAWALSVSGCDKKLRGRRACSAFRPWGHCSHVQHFHSYSYLLRSRVRRSTSPPAKPACWSGDLSAVTAKPPRAGQHNAASAPEIEERKTPCEQRGFLLQIFTGMRTPITPSRPPRQLLVQAFRVHGGVPLYPQTNLLGVRQHEQVANRRHSGLAVQESLGGLYAKLAGLRWAYGANVSFFKMQRTVFSLSAVTESMPLARAARSAALPLCTRPDPAWRMLGPRN